MFKNILVKFSICDILILFIIIGYIFSNYMWLKLDEYPALGHRISEIASIAETHKQLSKTNDIKDWYASLVSLFKNPHCYALYPMASFVLLVFYLLFGLGGQMVIMVNSFYIALTLICVYLIAKYIFNERIGLLAAFIMSSFPGFIAFSREYWLEFGLMAYVCLDLYLLLKTNLLERRNYSVMLGVSLSLSFLHKYEFIIFILGPLSLVLYKSGIVKDILMKRWSRKLMNLVLTLLIVSSSILFLFISHGREILAKIFFSSPTIYDWHELGRLSYLESILLPKHLFFYSQSIIVLIGIIYLGFFIFSLFLLLGKILIKKEKRFYIAYLFLGILIPFLFLHIHIVKNIPHMLSLLPLIAVLISAGIYFIQKNIVKLLLTALIILYAILLHLSFYFKLDISDIHYINPVFYKLRYAFTDHHFPPLCPPRKEGIESAIKETLRWLKADSLEKRNVWIFVLFQRRAFENTVFEYYNAIGDCNLYVTPFEPNYRKYNYIVIEKPHGKSIEDILSEEYQPWDNEKKYFPKLFKDKIVEFDLIKTYNIKGGDTSLLIYKRKSVSP